MCSTAQWCHVKGGMPIFAPLRITLLLLKEVLALWFIQLAKFFSEGAYFCFYEIFFKFLYYQQDTKYLSTTDKNECAGVGT